MSRCRYAVISDLVNFNELESVRNSSRTYVLVLLEHQSTALYINQYEKIWKEFQSDVIKMTSVKFSNFWTFVAPPVI